MEEDKKVELIHVAIHQIMDERRRKKKDKHKHKEKLDEEDEEEEGLLISRLLSKLESLENGEEKPVSTSETTKEEVVGMDEIVKELRRVKRQNHITHCLLMVMIAVTAFWQLSEVSLILSVKQKFTNPLQAVRNLVTGLILKGNVIINKKKSEIEATPLPPIAVPELPHIDLPSLTSNQYKD